MKSRVLVVVAEPGLHLYMGSITIGVSATGVLRGNLPLIKRCILDY